MHYHNVTIEEVARVINSIGLDSFQRLSNQLPEVGAKYPERTLGQIEALITILGDGNVHDLLVGDVKASFEEVIKKFVDQTGRGIPTHLGLTSAACDENRDFLVQRAEINYSEHRERFIEFFPPGTKFVEANELQDRAEVAKEKFLKDELVANLFQRAHLPLPLPQHDVAGNYGQSLQKFFLPAVKRAYESQFSERKFNNYRDGELAGKISVIPNVGHDKLIVAMAQGPGVAWYFPHPLQGLSVHAQREAMKMLLKHDLLLAGAIEPTLGIVGFTQEMVGSYSTPGYDCSAVSWRSADYSLYFKADDDELDCSDSGRLGSAYDGCSGGLVLLG